MAVSARMRAAALLGPSAAVPPFAEAAAHAPPAAPRAAWGAAAAADPPMAADLMERVLHGGSDAAHALRLLELQVLWRLAQS